MDAPRITMSCASRCAAWDLRFSRSFLRRKCGSRLRGFGRRLVDQRRRVRYGFEALLWNRFAGDFADAIGAVLDSTQGPFDVRQRVAVDRLFIRLDVEVIQTRRLVARIADARLFAHSLLAVAASQGHAGHDGVTF